MAIFSGESVHILLRLCLNSIANLSEVNNEAMFELKESGAVLIASEMDENISSRGAVPLLTFTIRLFGRLSDSSSFARLLQSSGIMTLRNSWFLYERYSSAADNFEKTVCKSESGFISILDIRLLISDNEAVPSTILAASSGEISCRKVARRFFSSPDKNDISAENIAGVWLGV